MVTDGLKVGVSERADAATAVKRLETENITALYLALQGVKMRWSFILWACRILAKFAVSDRNEMEAVTSKHRPRTTGKGGGGGVITTTGFALVVPRPSFPQSVYAIDMANGFSDPNANTTQIG